MRERRALPKRLLFWAQHLQQCSLYGLSLSAYAAEHGLAASSLYASPLDVTPARAVTLATDALPTRRDRRVRITGERRIGGSAVVSYRASQRRRRRDRGRRAEHGAVGRGRTIMMRPSNALHSVYLCLEPVEFRLQSNGLAARVQEDLALDALSEHLFAFTNRRRDRVKV